MLIKVIEQIASFGQNGCAAPGFCISVSILIVQYFEPFRTGQARYFGVGFVAFLLLLMKWVKNQYATVVV